MSVEEWGGATVVFWSIPLVKGSASLAGLCWIFSSTEDVLELTGEDTSPEHLLTVRIKKVRGYRGGFRISSWWYAVRDSTNLKRNLLDFSGF